MPVLPDDTVESLHERIKEVERRIYPEVLRALIADEDRERERPDAHEDHEGTALGVRQDRHRRVRPGAPASAASSWCRRGGTATAIAEAGIPVTAVDDITGVPPILDHRVVTLHPKIHGGILADRSKASHDEDMADLRHPALRPGGLEPLSVRPGPRHRDHRRRRPGDGAGGGEEPRVRHRRHRRVAVRPVARGAATPTTTRWATTPAASSPSPPSPAPRRSTPQIVAWLQRDDELPQYIDLALERTGEALRYGENPHQHAARYRIAGTDQLVGRRRAARRPGALATSTSTTPTPRGASCTTCAPPGRPARGRHHQARQPVRRRGGRRPRHRLPARARVRRAVRVRRHRRAEPPGRRRHRRRAWSPAAQADLVLAPGYEPGTIDALIGEAQEHPPPRGAGPPEPQTLDFRQISGGFLVQDAHHFAATRERLAGRHQARAHRRRVARRRAGLAHLRSREVERDRAGEGRPGRRHRRRAAEPGGVGRDRGQEGGRSGRRRRVRVATRSTRSPTASRRPRPPASR